MPPSPCSITTSRCWPSARAHRGHRPRPQDVCVASALLAPWSTACPKHYANLRSSCLSRETRRWRHGRSKFERVDSTTSKRAPPQPQPLAPPPTTAQLQRHRVHATGGACCSHFHFPQACLQHRSSFCSRDQCQCRAAGQSELNPKSCSQRLLRDAGAKTSGRRSSGGTAAPVLPG